VGRFADLALCPEGFLGRPRRLRDHVENDLSVRSAEADEEEPVIGRLAKAGPFEVKQRGHGSVVRQPVAPVAVRMDRDDGLRGQRGAVGDCCQTVEQTAGYCSVLVKRGEAGNLG
jgi:hypothetical protein